MREGALLGWRTRSDMQYQPGQDTAGLLVPERLLALAGPWQHQHVCEQACVIHALGTRSVDQVEGVVGRAPPSDPERVERMHRSPEPLPPAGRHGVVLALGVGDEDGARIVEQVGDHGAHAFA